MFPELKQQIMMIVYGNFTEESVQAVKREPLPEGVILRFYAKEE